MHEVVYKSGRDAPLSFLQPQPPKSRRSVATMELANAASISSINAPASFSALPLELQDHVAGLLPNRDRLALAQVSKGCTEVAERYIWRDLHSVAPLLLCLPRDAWRVKQTPMVRAPNLILSRQKLMHVTQKTSFGNATIVPCVVSI